MTRPIRSIARRRLLVVGISMALAAGSAQADTFAVTSMNDAGSGTLRQALQDVYDHDDKGPHLIDLSPIAGGTIVLESGLPPVKGDFTLLGSDVTVSGDDQHSCLDVEKYASSEFNNVVIEALTLTNCHSAAEGAALRADKTNLALDGVVIKNNVSDDRGGGIYVTRGSSTTTSIRNSVITNNQAGGSGGGVFVDSAELELIGSTISGNSAVDEGGGLFATGGSISIIGSTVSGNTAEYYGGAFLESGSSIEVLNTTISGNQALADVGGLSIYSYSYYGAPVTLDGLTITGNSADIVGGLGMNVRVLADPNLSLAMVRNSIIAGNSAGSEADLGRALEAEMPDIQVNYTVLGTAVDPSARFVLDQVTLDTIGADPKLGALADNGGLTWTHFPALDGAGTGLIPLGSSGCGTSFNIDQRGTPRPAPGTQACSAGSVERASSPLIFSDRFMVEP